MTARILVVEDTPANIQTLSAILKEEGYQISIATNGRQALEALERVRPDLILLDIMMPEMDGFETCRRIKASEAWREIPIIFLTAKTDTADIVRGFELGAVDYVAKPFNAHELLARVKTHLTVDELRRSLARAHELVRRAFGRYVSEEVATSILESPEGLELGGEEREVTILMSDLRGFTRARRAADAAAGDRVPQPLPRSDGGSHQPLPGHHRRDHRRRHPGDLRRAGGQRRPRGEGGRLRARHAARDDGRQPAPRRERRRRARNGHRHQHRPR